MVASQGVIQQTFPKLGDEYNEYGIWFVADGIQQSCSCVAQRGTACEQAPKGFGLPSPRVGRVSPLQTAPGDSFRSARRIKHRGDNRHLIFAPPYSRAECRVGA